MSEVGKRLIAAAKEAAKGVSEYDHYALAYAEEVQRDCGAALAARDAEIERLHQTIEAAFRALKEKKRGDAMNILLARVRLGNR